MVLHRLHFKMLVACLDVLLWNMLDLCFIFFFFFSVLRKKKFSAELRGVDLNAVGIHSIIAPRGSAHICSCPRLWVAVRQEVLLPKCGGPQ